MVRDITLFCQATVQLPPWSRISIQVANPVDVSGWQIHQCACCKYRVGQLKWGQLTFCW